MVNLRASGIGVLVVLVASALGSVTAQAAVTGHGSRTPASRPAVGTIRPPIRYAAVAAPARPDKPGHGAKSTSVVYPPTTIQTAYDFGSYASSGGSGQTIAVVDAYGDPTLTSDLATFDKKFGLTSTTVNVSTPDGAPTATNSSWAIETALDVEWAHANAPNATIDLVEAPDSSFQHLLDAVAYAISLKPAAVSMSWGAAESDYSASSCVVPGGIGPETCLAAYEAVFEGANTTTALFASSGDQGAYDGTHPKTLTVNYPASSPEVIAVGGTTLNVTSAGAWSSETAWSDSGGGYSKQFSEPSYQSGAGILDPSGRRGVPDVAFDANPSTGVYVYQGGTWYSVGGTSVGSPNWAAVAADAASSTGAAAVNLSGLYGLYKTAYSSDFHDIITGSNGYYSAGPGWDAVTGIGSPEVSALIGGL